MKGRVTGRTPSEWKENTNISKEDSGEGCSGIVSSGPGYSDNHFSVTRNGIEDGGELQ